MKSIGGYFSLELPKHKAYYNNAIMLNSGRSCLEYILRVREYKLIYIPYYTCEVILEPIKKLGIDYKFYHVNNDMEISDDIHLYNDESILYTNYYGLKSSYVKHLVDKYEKKIIIDNTQAFFSIPCKGIDTFNSCRKFYGVPDGAYLFCNKKLETKIAQATSYNRIDFLAKRIDISPEVGYTDFKKRDEELSNNPIKAMSNLTNRLMHSIDYNKVQLKRLENFKILNDKLFDDNSFKITNIDNAPMVYPYLSDKEGLRDYLIKNKIYVATYWPNVLQWTEKNSIEFYLTKHLIPLPIDQRYGKKEMNYIIKTIIDYGK